MVNGENTRGHNMVKVITRKRANHYSRSILHIACWLRSGYIFAAVFHYLRILQRKDRLSDAHSVRPNRLSSLCSKALSSPAQSA